MLVYGISLFLAIFVCRTVYYSINDQEAASAAAQDKDLPAMNATAYR